MKERLIGLGLAATLATGCAAIGSPSTRPETKIKKCKTTETIGREPVTQDYMAQLAIIGWDKVGESFPKNHNEQRLIDLLDESTSNSSGTNPREAIELGCLNSGKIYLNNKGIEVENTLRVMGVDPTASVPVTTLG